MQRTRKPSEGGSPCAAEQLPHPFSGLRFLLSPCRGPAKPSFGHSLFLLCTMVYPLNLTKSGDTDSRFFLMVTEIMTKRLQRPRLGEAIPAPLGSHPAAKLGSGNYANKSLNRNESAKPLLKSTPPRPALNPESEFC